MGPDLDTRKFGDRARMTSFAQNGDPLASKSPEVGLERVLESRRKQVEALEAELARRANGGASSDRSWAEATQAEH
jgi:hypothetical protein